MTIRGWNEGAPPSSIFLHQGNKQAEWLVSLVNTNKNRKMIEYIRGELTDLTPALATIEAAGVGYGLNISLNTYTSIQG